MAIELPLSPQWRLATSFHDLAMGLLRTWFGNGQNTSLAYRVVVRRVPHHSCISRWHCIGGPAKGRRQANLRPEQCNFCRGPRTRFEPPVVLLTLGNLRGA